MFSYFTGRSTGRSRNRFLGLALLVTGAAGSALAQNGTRIYVQDERNFGAPIPLQQNQQVVFEDVFRIGGGFKFVQVIKAAPVAPTIVVQLANGAVTSFTNHTDENGNRFSYQVVDIQGRVGVVMTMTMSSGQTATITKTFGAGASHVGGTGRSSSGEESDDRGAPSPPQPPGTHVFSPAASPAPPAHEAAVLGGMGIANAPAPQVWDLPSHLMVYEVPGVGPSDVYMQYGTIGDLNCDGLISPSDIGPFVIALTDPPSYHATFPGCDRLAADINSDREVSVGDIGGFVALITGG